MLFIPLGPEQRLLLVQLLLVQLILQIRTGALSYTKICAVTID